MRGIRTTAAFSIDGDGNFSQLPSNDDESSRDESLREAIMNQRWSLEDRILVDVSLTRRRDDEAWRKRLLRNAEKALSDWQKSEEGVLRCDTVSSTQREIFQIGVKACSNQSEYFRDLWCRNETKLIRDYTHPLGLVFTGYNENNSFVYLPVPKVASTMVRRWYRLVNQNATSRTFWQDLRAGHDRKMIVFALVRDPLDRFLSGWREVLEYERNPPERRRFGRKVLRKQQFFRDATRRSSFERVRRFFSIKESNASLEERQSILGNAIRDLACDQDWNEHLTPQIYFFPKSFLNQTTVKIAPITNVTTFMTLLADVVGLDPSFAHRFFAQSPAAMRKQRHKDHGIFLHAANTLPASSWPEPDDLVPALKYTDAHTDPYTVKQNVSTSFLWCWIYAPDYAAFPFFKPPEWCKDAYAHVDVQLTKKIA